jgi:cell division protein ZapA
MSTVTLTIGPKSYAIAVADGQEAHITQLGAMIAEKYAQLGSARAPLEAQNLLFAALFLADELAEAKKRLPGGPAPVDETPALRAEIARLQDELAAARKAAAAPRPAATAAPQADLFGGPDLTEALAERLEDLAARTEASAAALEALVASA